MIAALGVSGVNADGAAGQNEEAVAGLTLGDQDFAGLESGKAEPPEKRYELPGGKAGEQGGMDDGRDLLVIPAVVIVDLRGSVGVPS